MGTSSVEYKGFGFWTRNNFLESWLTTLLDEMRKLPVREPWQESLMEHWRVQIIIDGGAMAVGLDEFLYEAICGGAAQDTIDDIRMFICAGAEEK